MKRKQVILGILTAGLVGLGGSAYAASEHDGYWRGGSGQMRGEGPGDYGWSGPRWRDDDRRDYGPRGEGWRGRGDDNCGPGMGRGYGERGMGRHGGHGHHGGMHGMGRGRGYGMDHDGRGPGRGWGGGGRLSAADPADLDSVKKEISVTAAQEQAWTKYAAALKEVADARKTRRESIDRDAMRRMSPDDHRKFRDSMIEQRRREQDSVRAAVDEFVKTLDEKQLAIAREVLPGYAFGRGMHGAGMGWGGGRHR
jgi:LTXXQ motif family protein